MQIFDLKYRYKKCIARAMAELVLLVCMEGTLINNNLVSKSWALVVCKAVLPESNAFFLNSIMR